jgi:hypothetical protein
LATPELRKFENNAGACPAGSAPALFFSCRKTSGERITLPVETRS